MSLTAVFGARPTDERIGIYVVYNCYSVNVKQGYVLEQKCLW
jgi:hypothetical protein